MTGTLGTLDIGIQAANDIAYPVVSMIADSGIDLNYTTPRFTFLSIRDFGLLICQEWYLSYSGDGGVGIIETYALPDLDAAVKKEVGRAF